MNTSSSFIILRQILMFFELASHFQDALDDVNLLPLIISVMELVWSNVPQVPWEAVPEVSVGFWTDLEATNDDEEQDKVDFVLDSNVLTRMNWN